MLRTLEAVVALYESPHFGAAKAQGQIILYGEDFRENR
jgi:hypothetical protein